MSPSSKEPFEDKEIRCPRLGGPVTFGYCKIETGDRPCSRAITCWSPHFDVKSFFADRLNDDEYQRCFCSPPKSKIATLVELIEQAQRSSQNMKD